MAKPRRKRPYPILPGLVDCFPLKTREPREQDIWSAESRGEPIPQSTTYLRHQEIWPRIIESGGSCAENAAVEDALRASLVYKSWQQAMPFLKDVPILKKFRSEKLRSSDLNAVNHAILTHGMFLPAGQILYRGGNFGGDNLNLTDGPVSTTLLPSVARYHAIEVKGQIAVFRVMESNSIRAFVFSSRGHQNLKHEHEILLQNELMLSQPFTCLVGEISVIEYEVRAK